VTKEQKGKTETSANQNCTVTVAIYCMIVCRNWFF